MEQSDEVRRGARKRRSDPASWKRNVRKNANSKGLAHINSRGNEKAARAPKPCDCGGCRFKCTDNVTEAERSSLCSEYWELGDYKRQKDFILSRTKCSNVQRERPRAERRRTRERTVTYSFVVNSKEVRVCKKFFAKTLGVSLSSVDTAVNNAGEGGTFTSEDMRGKKAPANKTSEEAREGIKAHRESFPRIESHCTRADTRRFYLSQNLSISKMYRLCENDVPLTAPVKEKTHRRVFCNDYNYSFFRPKRDQCTACARYQMLDERGQAEFRAEYEAHLRRKDEARGAKSADKARATAEKEVFCV